MFFRSIVFIAFSLWFGGFLFYSAVVISNAHVILQDHETVGMITQRVTRVLNFIGVASCLLLISNLLKEKLKLSPKQLKASYAILTAIVFTLLAQFLLHSSMSEYIDPVKHELSEYKKFYRLHRIYLIISTAQFFFLLACIPLTIKSWSSAT